MLCKLNYNIWKFYVLVNYMKGVAAHLDTQNLY